MKNGGATRPRGLSARKQNKEREVEAKEGKGKHDAGEKVGEREAVDESFGGRQGLEECPWGKAKQVRDVQHV